MVATRAPELGWSPGAKQMIASSIQWIGWTKPLAGPEKQAPPVAQAAPAVPSIDPAQVQQMARDLATLRLTVEQHAAGQSKLEAADVEILEKITPAPPPPHPPTAPARKPAPVPPRPHGHQYHRGRKQVSFPHYRAAHAGLTLLLLNWCGSVADQHRR